MLQYPQTLAKVRKEVLEVIGTEANITRAQIQRMPYLQHVLKESK